LGLGGCIVQKSRPSSNLWLLVPLGAHPLPTKLWRWATTLVKPAHAVYSIDVSIEIMIYCRHHHFLPCYTMMQINITIAVHIVCI